MILSCTVGVLTNPRTWHLAVEADGKDGPLVWTLYLGPVFLALAVERDAHP